MVRAGAPQTSRIELRDGRVALVAPLDATDRRRYVVGLERLSPVSLYRRFMTPVARLTESQLRYLLAVDHRQHEALLAIDEDGGDAVGVARFVRLEHSPEGAEAALTVIDAWQGIGLGGALGGLLAVRARELGIERFEATVLRENRPMLALLESLGSTRVTGGEGAAVKLEVALEGAQPPGFGPWGPR